MNTMSRSRPAAPLRLAALALALVFAGSLAAAAPSAAEGLTFVPVSSLTRATRADKVVIPRLDVRLPIKQGVIGGTIRERIAYHYPGTSWPGGGSNTYLYGHARTGTFLALWKMRVGDIVRLRLVTGAWVKYRVTIAKRVAWNDGRWTLLTSKERLTLQTCTSYYRTADKFVVVAVPVS
jgi:LPXTG-site transpeptidase (sortase) family protein